MQDAGIQRRFNVNLWYGNIPALKALLIIFSDINKTFLAWEIYKKL